MISIGLTGNVASGKSTVTEAWSSLNVPVVSADELARAAVQPGSDALERIVEAFGPDVLSADGSMDRARVRSIVFEDGEARTRLEAIIHPEVWRRRDAWLEARRQEGAEVVCSEIPLLFETGAEEAFDVVVLVDAPEEVRLERMVDRRGIDRGEAERIIRSQMPAHEKRDASDHVIENAGSLDELRGIAYKVLDDIRLPEDVPRMLLDLHLHTRGSWDCLSDPELVLARALSLRFDRIAITDHNRVHVALDMAARHPDRIIPGEEVKTAEGIDVIGLYLAEEIPKGTPAEETIERIRAQGGLPLLPHPYAGGKGGGGVHAERLGALCDVIEVVNSRLHDPTMNQRAFALAERLGALKSAGSDAHTVGEVGNAFNAMPTHPNTPEGLRAALTQAMPGGGEAPRWVHLASTWAKVAKKLPGIE
ncbi:MAG: dephospho-CoA kinase [Gemmatimonadota bacterium]